MRYYMHDGPGAFRFELSGDLDAGAAARLEQDWRTASSTIGNRTVIVDLSFVTTIDEAGRRLFRRWHAAGAQFVAISTRSRELVEVITGVPLAPQPSQKRTYVPWVSPRSRSLSGSAIPLIALLTFSIPSVAWAGDDGASQAFAHYVTNLNENDGAQSGEDVVLEIEASLPKLEKRGRLDAVRHLGADGQMEYLIVRFDGDPTVKREVIARYLSLEQQASALPASAFAVTPENYKFRYAGSIERGDSAVYVFTIKPRHRRDGLIQGQIWIDHATGAVVHQEGKLMKSKSLFVREISISRESGPRAASPYHRVTHVSVETRLFGNAELTIRERPSASKPGRELTPIAESKTNMGVLR
jgi:hypothetical protein